MRAAGEHYKMNPPTITFRTLRVEGWRQFDNVDLELHPRLTVLTGANGAGKSSLLRIFSRHFGFDRPFLATPQITVAGNYSYVSGIFESLWKRVGKKKADVTHVGSLTYSNNAEALLQVPRETGVQYSINVSGQQNVHGIHIDSHQPFSPYQVVGQIPSAFISSSSAYQAYTNEVQNKYQGGHTGFSPLYRMKEALISMAMFGEGNTRVQGNEEVLSAYDGFIKILHTILPEDLGFTDIAIRPPEVVLVTKSGEFLLDASSGGVIALVDLAWRLYMFSLNQPSFVVTMDEPENHLHPTMQRTLMRSLLAAFPSAQFIIATHSPFMVSSVKDSNVYVLRYARRDQEGIELMATAMSHIVSERLDTIDKAGSASEILRDVLGVSTTIPEWVEEGIDAIVARYRQQTITSDMLVRLRQELASAGYSELYPDALAALTENR